MKANMSALNIMMPLVCSLCFLVIVVCSETTAIEKDRSLNEIPDITKDTYQTFMDNTIPTTEPQTSDNSHIDQDFQATSSTPKPKTKVTPEKSQAHRTTAKPRDTLDPIDKYLLDGLLQIVDDKFGTINKRIMTLEKGINNLQYYSVRSFRVVNTHLHAVDTILHGITSEINQVEMKNRDIEQGIGAVKNEMSDLQSLNNGMFQAIEQNLVHFHEDIKSRLSEFKSDLEVSNEHITGIKNDTASIKGGIETVRINQNALAVITDDININGAETAHSAALLVNVTLGILQESSSTASRVAGIADTLNEVSKNISYISSSTDEIKSGPFPYVKNKTTEVKEDDMLSSSGEVFDETNTEEMRVKDSQIHMTCSKLFEFLDEKLKTLKSDKNASCRIADSEDFKNDSRTLLKALSVVNENVLQSVTLYRHAGDLIERVISETEFIANEQVKLRGDIQEFLVNNSLYLEYLAQINETIDLSKPRTAASTDSPTTVVPSSDKRCDVSAALLKEVSQITRNSTELVELLTSLAETSSTSLKETIADLQTEVTKLHKVKLDHSRGYRHSKANLARDDPGAGGLSNGALKDLQNRTDWIYHLVEAVASNTGWIPYVFHSMRFVESQVNKTLKISNEISDKADKTLQLSTEISDRSDKTLQLSTHISEKTEEVLIRQRMESKMFNKVTVPPEHTTPIPSLTKAKKKELMPTAPSATSVPTKRPAYAGSRGPVNGSASCSNLTEEFAQMMEYVYETNIKIDRLIPALTNLLGEPEPYITLVGGESDREGRVEIYYKGVWGTVCEEMSHVEASYVCRNLGFLGGVSAGNGFFGAGSGPFWNVNVTCLRTHYCDAVKPVINQDKCDHNKDFAVICEHMIRLIPEDENETLRHSGMLEIFHDNRWSPVCAKGWGRNETTVVCRQLGFHEGAATAVKDDSQQGTYWMKNVTCKGHENRLDACAFDGFVFNACPDYKHISIICT